MAALPVVLVSPLLLSAAQPSVIDSISATCRLEDAVTIEGQIEGANVVYSGEATAQPRSSQSQSSQPRSSQVDAEVTSGNELTAFVRDRWNAARRLIRENPFFSNSTPEEQARAEALCLAQIEADYEVLLAQTSSEQIDAGASMALPDLGSDNNASSPASTTPPSSPQAQPAPVQTSPTVRPAVDPASIPVANDPSTYSGPEYEPTPYDGTVVRTLADFPDGNYRYISGEAEARTYSNAELRQRGGSVFVLRKVGNTVTGDLLPRIGLPGICVTGTVSGDVITGAAYPYDTTDTLQDSARQIGETYEPHGSGALKIRRTRTDGNKLYYAGALLDLTNFTPINAGTSLPPSSCQTGRTGGRDQG